MHSPETTTDRRTIFTRVEYRIRTEAKEGQEGDGAMTPVEGGSDNFDFTPGEYAK